MAIKIWGLQPYNESTSITIKGQDITEVKPRIELQRSYGDSIAFINKEYHVEINGNTLHYIFLNSLQSSAKFRALVLKHINLLDSGEL
jgi:hypothetical protein